MKIKLYLCGGEKPVSEYPLGLGYLKTNWAADVEIVKQKEQLCDCDLIGLSSNAWGLQEAVEILKNLEIPTIIGGQGALWKGLEDYRFKHIVIGEGETALDRIMSDKEEKIIKMNGTKDIDTIKFPERGGCGRDVPIITSRGCPYSCRFCTSGFWGKARFHSAQYFIEEINSILKKHNEARVIKLYDDLFIAHKKRFYEIYDLWMKKGFNKKLSLTGFVRADLLTEENIRMMKEMGFSSIRFGAESGSDRMLKMLNKGTTVAVNQEAINMANKTRMSIHASFMYDLPGETEEDFQMTKDFIAKNRGKMMVEGWYKFRSFPGSEIYDEQSPLEGDMRVR